MVGDVQSSMFQEKTLQDLIRRKIPLGKMGSGGFEVVKCAVCNDYKERAGFKFDGNMVGFSDFNCAAKFRYEEGSGKLGKKAREILRAFGITDAEIRDVTSGAFFKEKEVEEITTASLTALNLSTPEVALPPSSYQLGTVGHDEFQDPLIEYALSRHLDPIKHGLHFSLDPKHLNRLIIPYYRGEKIIYWQARSIGDDQPRYKNASVAKNAVLYGYDELTRYDGAPLFVTEGVFDAMPINGIAVMGSTLPAEKLEILRRCRRRLVFVIDRDRTGSNLAEVAIAEGWEVTFVDIRADDVSDSITKFGLPFTAYSLIKNTQKADTNVRSSLSVATSQLSILEARMRNRL